MVRPDDQEKVLEIFCINTCLWGGMFNPIIPFFEDVPSWWERDNYRFEDAKQIINGYLDFFEPDFLVEAEKGLADGFGFDPNRVLQLADILEDPVEGGWDKYGLSVHDLYSELYKEKFQFESRRKHNIVHVETKNSAFDGFVAANFGSFPVQEQFRYFELNYKGVFDPKHITLDAASFLEMHKSGWTSALGIGCEKLQVDYSNRQVPILFILDAQESRDLVDFWNLRAIHQQGLVIPIQWIEYLSPFCKEFILRNYHYVRGNPDDVMVYPTSIFSRSIPDNDIEEIHKNYLHVDKKRANTLQVWYPPIWSKPSEKVFSPKRPTLEAGKKSMDIQIDEDDPVIQFEHLFPEFASEYGSKFRLVNVVRLQDWSSKRQIATIFPCDCKNPIFPKFRIGRSSSLFTTEGMIIFPEYRNLSESWNLIDGTIAFNNWFGYNKVPATLSDGGRPTQQIIQTLGGFVGVSCLAHKGIIKLLNKIANRPVTKTIRYQKFQEEIHCAVDDEILKEQTFETLVKRRAVQLGLELKCGECGSWSWYSIKQIDYSLTCSHCFRSFDFPVTNPLDCKHSKWTYRVVGPFARPDYADGGYAAALVIRFLADVIGGMGQADVTWSSAQELTLPTNDKVEADFMLWYQRRQILGMGYPTETIFGEAKSFGTPAFKQDDVDKMKSLAETFPGSILVFATMKEGTEFSKKEINRIKKLAEWGREYDKARQQTRAPVIMLTGTELFAGYSLRASWEERGGKHKDLIKPASVRIDNLRVLADLTQQLYLGMPSYGSFLSQRFHQQNRAPKTEAIHPMS